MVSVDSKPFFFPYVFFLLLFFFNQQTVAGATEKVAGNIAGCRHFLITLLSMLKKSFIDQALGINVYQ